jgi:hypothetical protein
MEYLNNMTPIFSLFGFVAMYYVLYHTRVGRSFIEFIIEILNSF